MNSILHENHEQAFLASLTFEFPPLNGIDEDILNTGYYTTNGRITRLYFRECEECESFFTNAPPLPFVHTVKIIAKSDLHRLPEGLFRLLNLKCLELINIEENTVSDSLLRLDSLHILKVSFRRPAPLPAWFSDLKTVKVLSLGQVNGGFDAVLMHWDQLEEVSLNFCSNIPDAFDRLQNLRNVEFVGGIMPNFPQSLAQTPKMVSLSLRKCQLREIPFGIWNITTLETLDLSQNYLIELPHIIGILQRLKKIDISSNNLQILPPFLFELPELKALIAKRNAINKIDIHELPKCPLHTIDLEDNDLGEFPQILCEINTLKEINLGFNKISMLPPQITNLKLLESLLVEGNLLTSLPVEFGDLKSLTRLNLQSNDFFEIPRVVCKLTNLIELKIDSNKFSYIPECIAQLSMLESFWVLNQGIVFFPRNIGALEKLNELVIGNNVDGNEFPLLKGNSLKNRLKQISNWSPEIIIEKIQGDLCLGYFDLWISELGQFLEYIDERCKLIDNPTKTQWDRFKAEFGRVPLIAHNDKERFEIIL